MMRFDFKTRKIFALLLIVSQLVVNAGTQTFAVSFSKIVDNTLDAMQQPENISTKYYEEFYYESKTYLLNDGNEDNEDETNFDIANQNDEIENNTNGEKKVYVTKRINGKESHSRIKKEQNTKFDFNNEKII